MKEGNKKYVLTGGACSGKTTLLHELKKMGFNVLEEVGREVLKERKNFPLTLQERILREEIIFQKRLEREKEFEQKNSILFLDRGLVDSIAYSNHHLGFVPKQILDYDLRNRYDLVFILERMPFKQDGLREEKDDIEAEEVHNKIIKVYQSIEYSPIFVPIISVEKRADFILNCVKHLKGGK